LAGPGEILLDDGRTLSGDAVILATGSEPVLPQLFRTDDARVVTSDGLLDLAALPKRMAIVGGGVIGCEFASIFVELGVEVTVIEMLDQLLPGEDKRAGRALQQAFKKAGIAVLLGKPVTGVAAATDGVTLTVGGGAVPADLVLVAIGRRPLSHDLGYEEAGVAIDERGFVVVDETLRTSVTGIFAAGDLAGPPLLAHWAYHEGAVAAENAVTGSSLAVDRRVVPNCVFSHPEVASVGLSEAQAAAEGITVAVAAVRFNGNSKAVVEGEAEGFVRIAYDPKTLVVLGASLVGPHVTELVHEIALAVRAQVTLAEMASTIHAHPTLSEAIGEAALSGLDRGLHTL